MGGWNQGLEIWGKNEDGGVLEGIKYKYFVFFLIGECRERCVKGWIWRWIKNISYIIIVIQMVVIR